MFLCDYHTHSVFSFDASPEATVDAQCRAAIERGVSDLCITDHFEANGKEEHIWPEFDAQGAQDAIMAAKEKYRGKLHLTWGIEIGQGNQYPKEAQALLDAYSFEFVIGSLHNLRNAPDFYFYDFGKLQDAMPQGYIGVLFERYVNELCEMVDCLPKLDTVGHLTYMRRYIAFGGHDYDLSKHGEAVEKLYRRMIARQVALEVNVSTLWKGFPFAMPDRELLGLYRECGGELVTVGTDSHEPKHVGDCVEQAFVLLRAVGLDRVMVVREGRRELVSIK